MKKKSKTKVKTQKQGFQDRTNQINQVNKTENKQTKQKPVLEILGK